MIHNNRLGYLIVSYALVLSLGFFTNYSVYTIESASASSNTLSGIIFEDANVNSVLDASESGISNWLVQLSGTLSDGTSFGPANIKSDISGFYLFSDLSSGVYDLKIKDIPGWGNTTQSIISNLNLESDSHISNEFGVYKLGRITGFVYNDANGSLIKDPGDNSLPDWPVHLSMNGNTITTTTDQNSRYVFTNVESGIYSLTADLPSPYIATQPSTGAYNIEILSGTLSNQNLGVFKNSPSLLEGFGDIQHLFTEESVITQDGHLFAINTLQSIIHKYDLDGNLVSTLI